MGKIKGLFGDLARDVKNGEPGGANGSEERGIFFAQDVARAGEVRDSVHPAGVFAGGGRLPGVHDNDGSVSTGKL